MNEDYLRHHGVLGMKWGVRRYQNKDGTLNPAGKKKYQATSSDSTVTKRVKKDLANLSGSEFKKKYGTSTKTYMKRVDRYGDPYMNAPLAKIGKFLEKQAQNNANRYMKTANEKEAAKKNKKLDKEYLKKAKPMDNPKVLQAAVDLEVSLQRIKSKPKYKGIDLRDPANSKLSGQFLEEVNKDADKIVNKLVKGTGDSASGRYSVQSAAYLRQAPNGQMQALLQYRVLDNKKKKFVHSDEDQDPSFLEDLEYIIVEPEFDEKGQPTGVSIKGIKDEVQHSDITAEVLRHVAMNYDYYKKKNEIEDELAHHGVLGMKWGVRKANNLRRKIAGQEKYIKESPKQWKEIVDNDKALSQRRLAKYQKKLEKTEKAQSAPPKLKRSRSTRNISDKDLRRRVQRMRLEREYAELKHPMQAAYKKEARNAAAKSMNKSINEITKTVGVKAGSHIADFIVENITKKTSK